MGWHGKWGEGVATRSDGAAAAVHVPGASARGWVIYPEEVEVVWCKSGSPEAAEYAENGRKRTG